MEKRVIAKRPYTLRACFWTSGDLVNMFFGCVEVPGVGDVHVYAYRSSSHAKISLLKVDFCCFFGLLFLDDFSIFFLDWGVLSG